LSLKEVWFSIVLISVAHVSYTQSRRVAFSCLSNYFRDIERYFEGETEATSVILDYANGHGFDLVLNPKEWNYDSMPHR
jgi:hypothetical protein